MPLESCCCGCNGEMALGWVDAPANSLKGCPNSPFLASWQGNGEEFPFHTKWEFPCCSTSGQAAETWHQSPCTTLPALGATSQAGANGMEEDVVTAQQFFSAV